MDEERARSLALSFSQGLWERSVHKELAISRADEECHSTFFVPSSFVHHTFFTPLWTYAQPYSRDSWESFLLIVFHEINLIG